MIFRMLILLAAFLISSRTAFASPAYEAYLKGHDLNDQAKFAEALPFLDQAVTLDPKFADAYVSRGYAQSKLGAPEKAILDYEKALELDGSNKYALNNRGFTYLLLGRFDKAIADFDSVIAQDGEYEPSYSNRAEAELRSEQFEKAIADCAKAIALDPSDADPYITRGDVLALQGDIVAAIADYTAAIKLTPSATTTFHRLGEPNFKRAQMYSLLAEKDRQQASAQGYPVNAGLVQDMFKKLGSN